MKYNIGEWSEAYTFTKLIAENKIYASDENLNIIQDKYYTIIKVFKEELERCYVNDNESIVNIINFNGNIISSLPVKEFIEISEKTLNILQNRKKTGTFEIPEMENFLKKIGISNFKGSSNKKEDIKLELEDTIENRKETLTFSIKSRICANPTILNASKSTNFIYKINNITDEKIEEINNITGKNKLKQRFSQLYKNYPIEFIETSNKTFQQNMRLIDIKFPETMAKILLYYTSHEKINSISALTEKIIEQNPLKLSENEKELFYKKNMKDFILAVLFGMMPRKLWDGNYEISGGLLTVKENGKIVCHHLFYDKEALSNYLYKYTILETASTSRHDYGYLYKDNGNTYFKLNLQIRFK